MDLPSPSDRCLDCQQLVTFAARPGETTCEGCGLRLYVTDGGQLGRLPAADWQPGGIQGQRTRSDARPD
jgi:hypothetical protein